MLLPQRIAACCAERPDATAVLHVAGVGIGAGAAAEPPSEGAAAATTAISYGRLHRMAAAVAAALLPAAAEVRGCTAAVLLDEAPASVIAELGALYAGVAFVPLDAASPTARLLYQCRDSGARVVIHSRAQAALVRGLQEGLGGGVRAVELEQVLAAIGGDEEGAGGDPPAPATVETLRASDACHVIYTSGSTGAPKGVVCEHGALAHYADAKLHAHGIDKRAHVLLVSAATWDPSVGDAFSTLACGATLVTAPRARLVQDLGAVLCEGAVSHVCSTPALWGMLPACASWASFPALRVVALGGERLPRALVEQWQPPARQDGENQKRRLLNTYGVTEATVYQTVGECCSEDRAGVVGRPLPGVVCAVAAPPGESGEIWIGGPLLARGYLGAADLTAQKFVTVPSDGRRNTNEGGNDGIRWLQPGRWFRTGDLGRWHGASTAVVTMPTVDALAASENDANEPVLELMGRIDRQIKLRGFRIELGELESVVEDHVLIVAAAVVMNTVT
jgi:non-ribosomal peptide synthetase component F